MITNAVIDFVSRECKIGSHENCYGTWEGLGFEIICNCKCGHKKNRLTLGSVEGPIANIETEQYYHHHNLGI